MSIAALQREAAKTWDSFTKLERPRILVGAATCGKAAGAKQVLAAFKELLEERSVEADFSEVGCLGMCYAEPLVEIGLPDGRRVLYANVTEKTARILVDEFVVGGNPVPAHALAYLGDRPVDGDPAGPRGGADSGAAAHAPAAERGSRPRPGRRGRGAGAGARAMECSPQDRMLLRRVFSYKDGLADQKLRWAPIRRFFRQA